MRLFIITTEQIFSGEAAIIHRLLSSGDEVMHLRKPQSTQQEMRGLLSQIDRSLHQRIVLHDHFLLLKEFNLRGIHLNRRNLSLPENMQKDAYSVSKSCHSIDELENIEEFDYVFLSPVFDSISKSGYPSAFNMDMLTEASRKGLINEKVIALGGINESTIPIAKSLGFGGVAVLGGLWENGRQAVYDGQALANKLLCFRELCKE